MIAVVVAVAVAVPGLLPSSKVAGPPGVTVGPGRAGVAVVPSPTASPVTTGAASPAPTPPLPAGSDRSGGGSDEGTPPSSLPRATGSTLPTGATTLTRSAPVPASPPITASIPLTPTATTTTVAGPVPQLGPGDSVAPSAHVADVPVTPTIQAFGTHLVLNGSIFTFTGVDAYEIATVRGDNAGCGGAMSDAQLDQLFSSLPPDSLVRFWAFQGGLATDPTTGQLDWGPIDRVFAAAEAYHQRLIPAITDQGGTCDGQHWQDPAWYDGGFRDVFNDPSTTDGRGLTPLSYWTYLQDIVNRYKDSPALGMWEPISEAEASTCPAQYQPTDCSGHQTCPSESAAASALRYFFDTVGDEIHTLDPDHLVESGLLGGDQCGIVIGDFATVSASPGIDVLSHHDYYGPTPPRSPGWQADELRVDQALALNKPIIAGEVGIPAGTGPGCVSLDERNRELSSKLQAFLQAGGSGSLLWDWTPDPASACSLNIGPDDPVMEAGGAVG